MQILFFFYLPYSSCSLNLENSTATKKKTPETLQSFRGLKLSMCLKGGRERNQKALKSVME